MTGRRDLLRRAGGRLRAAFRADIAASGSGWWVDPVDAALLAAVEIAVDAEAALLSGGGRGADRGRADGRAPAALRLVVDAGVRREIAGLDPITCEAAAALVAGGELRLLPRAEQPRLRRAYWSLLPVDDANATFYADLAGRVLPLAGCATFAELLASVEAERGLARRRRPLPARAARVRPGDPAARVPLPGLRRRARSCRRRRAGGEQVWAAEAL